MNQDQQATQDEAPVETLGIDLLPVTSSNIEWTVGYDADSQRLGVKFKSSKKAYAYTGVPAEVYEAMIAADSIGKFIGANLVGKFNHKTFEI